MCQVYWVAPDMFNGVTLPFIWLHIVQMVHTNQCVPSEQRSYGTEDAAFESGDTLNRLTALRCIRGIYPYVSCPGGYCTPSGYHASGVRNNNELLIRCFLFFSPEYNFFWNTLATDSLMCLFVFFISVMQKTANTKKRKIKHKTHKKEIYSFLLLNFVSDSWFECALWFVIPYFAIVVADCSGFYVFLFYSVLI